MLVAHLPDVVWPQVERLVQLVECRFVLNMAKYQTESL